jgi:hypothetical protein
MSDSQPGCRGVAGTQISVTVNAALRRPAGCSFRTARALFRICLSLRCVLLQITSAQPPMLVLQASSPDEEALVTGVAFLGYRLYSRTTDKVVVEVLRSGEYLTYQVRCVRLGSRPCQPAQPRISLQQALEKTPGSERLVRGQCQACDSLTRPVWMVFALQWWVLYLVSTCQLFVLLCRRQSRLLVSKSCQLLPARCLPCWSSTRTASACPSSPGVPTARSASSARAPIP